MERDYMMAPARSVSRPPMESRERSFQGFSLRYARRPGGEACVFADDSWNGIGSDMTGEMRSLHEAHTFVDSVLVDGMVREVRLITRGDFLFICLRNRSSRLDAFRRQVVALLERFEDAANPEPDQSQSALPPDAANDPIIAMRLSQLKLEEKVDGVRREVQRQGDSYSREIQDIRQEIGRGPGAWTTPVWLKHKGIRFVPEVPNRLGRECRKVCLERGIAIPEEKVCNGSSFDSRMWPAQVIEDAWDRIRHQYGK